MARRDCRGGYFVSGRDRQRQAAVIGHIVEETCFGTKFVPFCDKKYRTLSY
jgi:hypothetical protein